MKIQNLQNDNRKLIKSVENFRALEYVKDASALLKDLMYAAKVGGNE